MNSDPADARAASRACLGLTRELHQDRATLIRPAVGGSRGYPVWFRTKELARHESGENCTVSIASIHRWQYRVVPYRMTGNSYRNQVVGMDLLLMSLYLVAYPDVTHDQMAAFIYNQGGGLYSRSALSKRMHELNLTRKKASTEAYQGTDDFTPSVAPNVPQAVR